MWVRMSKQHEAILPGSKITLKTLTAMESSSPVAAREDTRVLKLLQSSTSREQSLDLLPWGDLTQKTVLTLQTWSLSSVKSLCPRVVQDQHMSLPAYHGDCLRWWSSHGTSNRLTKASKESWQHVNKELRKILAHSWECRTLQKTWAFPTAQPWSFMEVARYG